MDIINIYSMKFSEEDAIKDILQSGLNMLSLSAGSVHTDERQRGSYINFRY